MNFSELFIRRPIMTLLLTISITVFGIQVFRQLPVNDLPAVDYPVIQVSVNYPGASPETMANTCATPLEKQFLQIPGLRHRDIDQSNRSIDLGFAILFG